MNEDELVQRGTAAQELLKNPTFHEATKELLDHYVSTILATAPNDEKTRSSAYYQCRALQDLIAVLQQWETVKEQIISSQNEDQSVDDDDLFNSIEED